MRKPNLSALLLIANWLLVIGAALFLGWALNCAYFSALGETQEEIIQSLSLSSASYGPAIVPYTLRSVEAFLVIQAVVCGLSLLLSFFPAGTSRRTRVLILLASVLLPMLLFAVGNISRILTEKGVVSVIELEGIQSVELQVGESFMIGGLKFSKSATGMAVENMLDTRSVLTILLRSLRSLWVNHLLFVLLTAALFAAVLARLAQQYLLRGDQSGA